MRYLILVLSALLMCVTNDGYTQNKNKKEGIHQQIWIPSLFDNDTKIAFG